MQNFYVLFVSFVIFDFCILLHPALKCLKSNLKINCQRTRAQNSIWDEWPYNTCSHLPPPPRAKPYYKTDNGIHFHGLPNSHSWFFFYYLYTGPNSVLNKNAVAEKTFQTTPVSIVIIPPIIMSGNNGFPAFSSLFANIKTSLVVYTAEDSKQWRDIVFLANHPTF